jgi:hypothetical protein
MQTISPESTGVYKCGCGNEHEFVGYDERGFPGDACQCSISAFAR